MKLRNAVQTKRLLTLLLILVPSYTWAWGEHGHDTITRAAIARLAVISNHDQNVLRPFGLKAHMLSHLSNVPDIVWRSQAMSDAERQLNFPTHFISIELTNQLYDKGVSLPTHFSTYQSLAKLSQDDDQAELGSAPYRVIQLYNDMVEAFRLARTSKVSDTTTTAINDALLAGGLLSHFVGDLANPHHTTTNYDGQLSHQTGLHAYFESDLVREMPIDHLVRVSERDVKMLKFTNAHALINWLVYDSYSKLELLHTIDRKHAVIQTSSGEDDAVRKPAKQVYPAFADFIEQRLATGSEVLAQLWLMAWEQAGRPNMSTYRSYVYPVAPAFVMPDYLAPKTSNSQTP